MIQHPSQFRDGFLHHPLFVLLRVRHVPVRVYRADDRQVSETFFPFSFPALPPLKAGTIAGIVSDSSGAPIPGATIRIVNAANGAVQDAVTDGQGAYEVTVRKGCRRRVSLQDRQSES